MLGHLIGKKFLCFAGGVLLGTAGIAILSSKDAKKAYTHCTAAVFRGRDRILEKAETLKENCDDICADAEEINEKRYAEERKQEIEDAKAMIAECEEKIEEAKKALADDPEEGEAGA